jgi:hypothetical protein
MKFTSLLASGLALASTAAFGQGFLTTEPSYLNAESGADFTFSPIVTVGDRVPVTPGTGPTGASVFAFCGIPDAMGLYKDSVTGENILFVAHETPSSVDQGPFDTLAGTSRFKGAWVSRFVLNGTTGAVISGSVAHKELFFENVQAPGALGQRPPLAGDATGFTRFCSGSFAGRGQGVDRPMFFTNEESTSGNYDAKGSQTVVIANGKMYTVPRLGRVCRETTIVQPRRDDKMVVLSTEDGPATGNNVSYIYMYVGKKLRRSSSVLDKNGLTNGKIYVLCGNAAQDNEGTFTSGTLPTKWVEIPSGHTLTAEQLSTQSDILGGFGLVRAEDLECDPTQPARSVFIATTGGSGPNKLGRLYELTMNPINPTANGTLKVVYNADTIIYPSGTYSGASPGTLRTGFATGALGTYNEGTIGTTDYPVSIDNIAVSKDFIVVCEDRNGPADAVLNNYARNGGVWTLNRNAGYAAKLQSTFNSAYVELRDGTPATPRRRGSWETSGVIVSDAIFGPGTFVINVQAHLDSDNSRMRSNISKPAHLGGGTYTKAEAVAEFTEDGQLLIMRPAP